MANDGGQNAIGPELSEAAHSPVVHGGSKAASQRSARFNGLASPRFSRRSGRTFKRPVQNLI
jgi:hypothetical protein